MPEKDALHGLLSQLGLSRSLQRIKFGGVVGKQTLLGVVGAAALAAIAWKADPGHALTIALLAAGVVILVAILNFLYSHKHPAEATLEGAEMLVFQQQVLAAKYLEPPRDSPVIPDPRAALPHDTPPTETEQ